METIHRFEVAIVGGGPAGLGVAVGLARRGCKSILLIERNAELGGIPSLYKKKPGGIRSFANRTRGRLLFGEQYADWLKAKLNRNVVMVWLESKVLTLEKDARALTLVSPEKGCVRVQANAIVLACGAREHTLDELGWVSGARAGRVYQTKSLIELLDRQGVLPMRQPVVIGSHLNAYAVAAKLKAKGAQECVVLDAGDRPKCPLYGLIYFRLRGSNPRYIGGVKTAKLTGQGAVSRVELDSGVSLPCDGIVVSSDLIPNSELAWLGGLNVEMPARKPVVDSNYQLSVTGWFAVGNILGGFHDAEWCYHRGLRAAARVARFISGG